jgi:phosphate binding protein
MSANDTGTGVEPVSKRTLLATIGAAGAASLAGCIGSGNDAGQDTYASPDSRSCDGVDPSLENAKQGTYTPLSRPLFTYPSKSSLGEAHVAEFARFFVEQSGNEDLVAGSVGYVPKTQKQVDEQMKKLNAATEEAGGPAPGEAGDLSGEINIAGSSTVFPLAEAVAEEFQKKHDDVDLSIQSTGSGGGFQNFFCPGKTDFNNASRPMKDEEKQLCNDNDVEWVELDVATDALTVVVNNDNDWANCLTVDELKQIWGPDAASKWSDIYDEWPDQDIERFGAAETSGTFDYFTETIMGEEGAHTSDYQPTEKDNTIARGVTGSRWAIGYFGFSYYYNNPDQLTAASIDDS